MASIRMSTSSNDTFVGANTNDVLFVPNYPSASNSRILFGPHTACNGTDHYPVLALQESMATVGGIMSSAAVNTNLVHSTGIHLTVYDPSESNTMDVVAPMYLPV